MVSARAQRIPLHQGKALVACASQYCCVNAGARVGMQRMASKHSCNQCCLSQHWLAGCKE